MIMDIDKQIDGAVFPEVSKYPATEANLNVKKVTSLGIWG